MSAGLILATVIDRCHTYLRDDINLLFYVGE